MAILHKNVFWLLFILIVAFFIRTYNIWFPAFTADEARIAYRGYTLATTGKDELGRTLPILFNSLEDYQLPVVSYLTAAGELIFGKSEFGARIPFILISILIVVLIYQISKIFESKMEFRLLCALIAAFSPALIFSSKIPNEIIVLTFSLILLFNLLTKKKINLLSIGFIMVFALATSKIAWWVLMPFISFTLIFFQTSLSRRMRMITIIISLLLTIVSIALFLQTPQSTRSLGENNFSLFQESSIKVAENKLRGQGLESGWPNFLEKIIFNKFQFITVGFLNWISNLEPAILFSQFDETGVQGFTGMGAFPKVLIISFVIGIIFIIRRGNRKFKALIFYFLILIFPLFFIYPNIRQSLLIPVLPFVILIMAVGLINLNWYLRYLLVGLMVVEVFLNMFYLMPEIKTTNQSRPIWIKQIAEESYNLSVNSQVAISDNLALDVVPFLEWYTPIPVKNYFKDVEFPYKFHQAQLPNIKIIGTEDTFYFCCLDKPTYVIASSRDLAKIQKWLNIDVSKTVEKIYKDNLDIKKAFLLKPTICVK